MVGMVACQQLNLHGSSGNSIYTDSVAKEDFSRDKIKV